MKLPGWERRMGAWSLRGLQGRSATNQNGQAAEEKKTKVVVGWMQPKIQPEEIRRVVPDVEDDRAVRSLPRRNRRKLISFDADAGDSPARIIDHGVDFSALSDHHQGLEYRRERATDLVGPHCSGAIRIDGVRAALGGKLDRWRRAIENYVDLLAQIAFAVEVSHGYAPELAGHGCGGEELAFDGECVIASKSSVRARSIRPLC